MDITAGQYHVFTMGYLVRLAVAQVDQRLTVEQAEDLAAQLRDMAIVIRKKIREENK